MTVKKRVDTQLKKVILKGIADVPGGLAIKTSELGDDFLFEGTVIGAPSSGLCSVVKMAKLVTAATNTATTYEVEKGHHLKVGDIIMAAESAIAYAITSIDKTTNTTKDVLTVGTTLGVVIAVGAYVVQAAAQAASNTSALKVTPYALVGTGYPVVANDNIVTDAIVMATIGNVTLPAFVLSKLKGIVNL